MQRFPLWSGFLCQSCPILTLWNKSKSYRSLVRLVRPGGASEEIREVVKSKGVDPIIKYPPGCVNGGAQRRPLRCLEVLQA